MNILALNAGLGGLVETLRDNWIGPAFIIIVAAIALTLVIKKEFRALIAFGVVAIIGALFIFAGNDFFGSSGSLTEAAKDLAGNVNSIFPWIFH